MAHDAALYNEVVRVVHFHVEDVGLACVTNALDLHLPHLFCFAHSVLQQVVFAYLFTMKVLPQTGQVLSSSSAPLFRLHADLQAFEQNAFTFFPYIPMLWNSLPQFAQTCVFASRFSHVLLLC